ncbi:Lrp/AsnC family transcriptional regulator [Oceanospirillum sediminis]|uniref:Lrp/AsnC family transcriptional regulator n=1 Tax=Oceanospirillum sediminis TaxID=2760088 RepID=A0A839ITY5_9GAMM|nr:Lrp/AsnC family transcriptional regulator [Oceanospirillum sediminis]MBB1487576.1 Lrp/AsnC family transcriptional regulator [Oceanospirillum sediminis]
MSNLDHIDRQLIGLLRSDARMPVAALAKAIGTSRATVQNRLNRMEKQGVITGYTVLLSSETDESLSLVRALMSLSIEGNCSIKIREQLMKEPGVRAFHSTNGKWDLVVELQTSSLEAFDKVLGRIRRIEGISGSETSILLSSTRMGTAQI